MRQSRALGLSKCTLGALPRIEYQGSRHTIRHFELQQIHTSSCILFRIVPSFFVLNFPPQPLIRQPLQGRLIRRTPRMLIQQSRIYAKRVSDLECREITFERMTEKYSMWCDERRGTGEQGGLDGSEGVSGGCESLRCHTAPFCAVVGYWIWGAD